MVGFRVNDKSHECHALLWRRLCGLQCYGVVGLRNGVGGISRCVRVASPLQGEGEGEGLAGPQTYQW